jgi:D-serine deaminase-like pyridoxal phosphate-dependent protein
VRCRSILDHVLARDRFSGVMAYSVDEAIWLARSGHADVLLAYPTADRVALVELAVDHGLQQSIMIMVDSLAHIDLATGIVLSGTMRVCLDVDASLRVGPLHLGVRRSPVRTAPEAIALANQIGHRAGISLDGVMFYDAQIAGLPDTSAPVRMIKKWSAAELLDRRATVIDALAQVVGLTLINGGGTGSLHITSGPPRLRPAGLVAAADPWWPRGSRLLGAEGAGEVQAHRRSQSIVGRRGPRPEESRRH